MAQRVKKKKFTVSRTAVLAILFIVLSGILIHRLYRLQIIDGESYRQNFSLMTTKTRTIKSTRGNIYDRNGNVLASSTLSYTLTIEDNGSYSSTRLKYLSLNAEALRISRILEEHGNSVSVPFYIVIGEDGEYEYTVSGSSLERFRADVYGYASVDDLKVNERNSTAEEMMATLASEDRFCVLRTKKPYTEDELTKYQYPAELTKEEILNIVKIRYALFTTSFQKYLPVTIATDLSDELVAIFTENKDTLTGIEIAEDTKRVYTDPIYFASIIGYTGTASAEDLAEFGQENPEYNRNSVVGKSGIERVMETTLQGSDGSETVYVDIRGTVLKIDEESGRDPVAGNDVYLTLDRDLQIATYKMLEQRIAGILVSVIVDAKEQDLDVEDTESIKIPSYDVYFALINNAIIDVKHFTESDASEYEKQMAREFSAKRQEIFADLGAQLTGTDPSPYNELSQEMQEYESYIVNEFLTEKTGILNTSAIDKTDETYLAWTRDESISLREYLTYAASQNWIDITEIAPDDNYIDSTQIYEALSGYIEENLSEDSAFCKLLYKHLIYDDRISGKQILHVLYDQGVLDKEDGVYDAFVDGSLNTFDTLKEKIMNLDITPAMLALDPCSGSAVVTNPNTGEILACVTYPGYDNNRLANTMDTAYYRRLAADLSRPFYNKATQVKTAPGSTFKLVTTAAGMMEGVIGPDTEFECDGVFDLTETPLRCWDRSGHGILDLRNAIAESCNVYFCNVAFALGTNTEGNWSDSLSLSMLQKYSKEFDLDKASGIEIPEASPQVSDQFAIQSAIGQGTHSYTTTQLARYVSTLANGGTSYDLSILDKVTDAKGELLVDYAPEIESRLTITSDVWDVIHEGMRAVVAAKTEYADMPVNVAGKTGTAQESKSRPSHALFVCYAPYEDPEISMAVRVSNGYSSTNTIVIAKDILQYYFGIVEPDQILTGRASLENISSVQVD